jgi:Flp pilus assembly protein TadD
MEAYRQKGDKAKVAEYEKKYAAANPDNPDILYNQAVDLYNKNNFKGAEPILRKLLEAKPDHAKANFLLGMCCVNLNKIPDMKKYLTEYLKLEPTGSDAAVAKEMLDAFK